MKKRLLTLLAIPTVFVLASCSDFSIASVEGESSSYSTTEVTTESENKTQTKTITNTPKYEKTTVSMTLTNDTSKETNIEDTVDMVYDSVVSITASSTSAISSGSGVLIGYDTNLGLSYLVTCFHVIEDAYSFDITLNDGNVYSAELVGGYE